MHNMDSDALVYSMTPRTVKNHHLCYWQWRRTLQDVHKSSGHGRNGGSTQKVTLSISLLWVSADRVLVEDLGRIGINSLPSLHRTVNGNYEQGTSALGTSPKKRFMSSQSDNNYKIEIGEKKNRFQTSDWLIYGNYMYSSYKVYLSASFLVICSSHCSLRRCPWDKIVYQASLGDEGDVWYRHPNTWYFSIIHLVAIKKIYYSWKML